MRGNITRRGKASWQLKFDVGAVNGKRQTRYATVRGTRQDAQRELTRLLKAADDGVLPDPNKLTVAEHVRGWVATVPGRSPKTLERYGELCERQIVPHIGTIPLQKLRAEDVQQWHGKLLSGDRPLARRTVVHAHRLLSLAVSDAVKNGTLARNVVDVHKPPTPEDAEVSILSPEQIEDVLDKLQCHWLHPIVSLALDTGMRRGRDGRRPVDLSGPAPISGGHRLRDHQRNRDRGRRRLQRRAGRESSSPVARAGPGDPPIAASDRTGVKERWDGREREVGRLSKSGRTAVKGGRRPAPLPQPLPTARVEWPDGRPR